jgi:predicted RNA-binding Zn ribbon-like protein
MDTEPAKSILSVTPQIGKLPYIVLLPLIGDRPCLDFANTIERRSGSEHFRDFLQEYSDLLAFALRLSLISVETYAALSASSELHPEAAAKATIEARDFRDTISRIISDISGQTTTRVNKAPNRKDIALFDEARHRAHIAERLVWKADRLTPVAQPEADGIDLPWLVFVRDADSLFQSTFASHIRVCAADGCGRVFLDMSKNGTRRWCSMKTCGNRVKATRFRTRGREGRNVPRGTS